MAIVIFGLSFTTIPTEVTVTTPFEPTITSDGYCSDQSGNITIDYTTAQLEDKYSLCFTFLNPAESYFITHKYDALVESDFDELEKYVILFAEEFNKYPVQFIKNTNLKGVSFVKNNSVSGQFRSAAPDYYNENLYYDIYNGNWDKQYQRSTIHHEFYHNIEEEFYGDPYYFDPVWNSFNNKTFEYGDGGASCYAGLPDLESGFISAYAMCGLEEDKAETFSELMTNYGRDLINTKIKNGDKILENKVNYLINFLETKSLFINL